MKNWGLVLVIFYAIVVFLLLSPAAPLIALFAGAPDEKIMTHWATWLCAGVIIAGEVLLLWLGADSSRRKLKPRTHILFSIASAAFFMAILTVGVAFCFGIAIRGDEALPQHPERWAQLLGTISTFAIPWLVWAVVFYRLWKNASDPITRGVAWLFRGSVLELLVAVPAHVISRRRGDCCAPLVSGIGMSCGVAIMLLSFGPSVLLLFKKRMDKYSREETVNK